MKFSIQRGEAKLNGLKYLFHCTNEKTLFDWYTDSKT